MTNSNMRVSEPFLNIQEEMCDQAFQSDAINTDNFKKHGSSINPYL